MTVTKASLSEKLYSELGFNKQESKEFVDSFFEELRVALESNNPVKLSGFGGFDLRDKKERPGRNPRTGDFVPVSARRVVTFKAGQKLKRKINSK
jgi:integration host factor subunit alpha